MKKNIAKPMYILHFTQNLKLSKLFMCLHNRVTPLLFIMPVSVITYFNQARNSGINYLNSKLIYYEYKKNKINIFVKL